MGQNVYQEDIAQLVDQLNLSELEGQSVLITGATGLIGRMLTDALLTWNIDRKSKAPIRVLALCRSRKKAERIFTGLMKPEFVIGDVCSVQLEEKVDYIIHGASMTSSQAFVNQPVEIIATAYEGTKNMLEAARNSGVKRFVYMSTMEIYGLPSTDEKIFETHGSTLNTANVRSCYAESKRLCENLCISYQSEYQVPVNVIRLTQSFGPGVQYDDGRVFAQFARCAIEGQDIVLKTRGETKRSYLYIADAVSAILTIMLRADAGNIYNAANETTYCSIYQMAELVTELADQLIQVKLDLSTNAEKLGYAPTLHINLDTTKLQSLGWRPQHGLREMFERTIEFMKKVQL